jgi:hypothetical protein
MAHNLEFSCKQASCHCRQRLTNPCLFPDLSNHLQGPFEICTSPNAFVEAFIPRVMRLVSCNCFDCRAHGMQDPTIKKPVEDSQAEPVQLERRCPICSVSVFVVNPIHMAGTIGDDFMTWN